MLAPNRLRGMPLTSLTGFALFSQPLLTNHKILDQPRGSKEDITLFLSKSLFLHRKQLVFFISASVTL